MAIWIIPVIIAGAIVVGLITGLIIGNSQVKRSRPGYKPLLSLKEKLIYSALAIGGVALILMGAFYKPAETGGTDLVFEQPPAEIVIEETP